MKFLTGLRFAIVTFIIYRTVLALTYKSQVWDMTEIIVNIVMNSMLLLFIYYSIREGASEWVSKPSPNAKGIRIFGLVFEIIFFIGGLWVLIDTPWEIVKFWKGSISILFVFGILVLGITDYLKLNKKIKE